MIAVFERIQGMAKAIAATLASGVGVKASFEAYLPDGVTLPWFAWVGLLAFVFLTTYQTPNKATAEAPAEPEA